MSVPGRKRENLIFPMRGSIREIDLGCGRAVRINGREQVWTPSCEPRDPVFAAVIVTGTVYVWRNRFLLKGGTCVPVCRGVQVLPPVLGAGGGLKLRIRFKVLLF